MDVSIERRLLQLAVGIGSLVPLLAGGAGMVLGADMLRGVGPPVPPDLDSHMRYLSGLLCGTGAGFLSCVPRIEARGHRLRLLGAIVLVGGAGRALGLLESLPGTEHRLALGMELGVMPALMLWQWRVERLWARQVS